MLVNGGTEDVDEKSRISLRCFRQFLLVPPQKHRRMFSVTSHTVTVETRLLDSQKEAKN